jgi:hypothetical protein
MKTMTMNQSHPRMKSKNRLLPQPFYPQTPPAFYNFYRTEARSSHRYVSDEPVSDDDDDDSDMKSKPPAKRVAQRAVARATASGRRGQAVAKPAAVTKKPAPKKVGQQSGTVSPSQKLRQLPPRTRALAAVGKTRSSYQQATTKNTATPIPNRSGAPTIKLKIGKDRLRQVTSSWTPPPDAGGRAAASKSAGTSTTRGRKIVQEESDDEEEEDEDESKMDEDEQPDDELGDEDAEGETDDELMDSDDEGATPGTDLSRTGTPDMSRLTNRQRTRLGDITTADLLELPSGYGTRSSVEILDLWLIHVQRSRVPTKGLHSLRMNRS